MRRITSHLFSGEFNLYRRFSTATTYAPPPQNHRHEHHSQPQNHHFQHQQQQQRRQDITKETLQGMLLSVGPTGSVTQVLHSLLRNGGIFTKSDLLHSVQFLRNLRCFNQCLELLDWIKKGNFGYSDSDYALHLNIMSKVRGIEELENFFVSIPLNAKKHHSYGALLNAYCANTMTEKALAIFEKMDELNFAINYQDYNNIIGLFLKTGKPEKVPSLIKEMKARKIPLSENTYCMWIKSCRHLLDLEGIENIKLEVQKLDFWKDDWQVHTHLASAYINVGQIEKAEAMLRRLEKLLDRRMIYDLKPYHFLISLYANMGNLESVYRSWFKIKSVFKSIKNSSFLIMLQALSKLEDLNGLESCLKEWDYRSYDDKLPGVVISAYLKHDKLEEAEKVLKDSEDKVKRKLTSPYIPFINYFIEKHRFDLGMKYLDLAMANGWKPFLDKLDPFFENFKEEKDVDSAEEFVRKLGKIQPLDLRTFSWLLRIYDSAGLEVPEMCRRMELLHKKCHSSECSSDFPLVS